MDVMNFPQTVDEFMEQYKIVDREEVYTNGAEMVPIFRMKQWFEHEASTAQPKHGKWHTENNGYVVLDICDQCMRSVRHVAPFYDFCPHCGADMREVRKDGTD